MRVRSALVANRHLWTSRSRAGSGGWSSAAPDVPQVHSYDFRSPADVPAGEVLVVGGGNSAARFAVELAATHAVTVAAPRTPWYLPAWLLGVDLYWWTYLTGPATPAATAAPPAACSGEAIVGTQLRDLDRAGRVLASQVVAANGRAVHLADGTALTVSSVLWCTGFRRETSWLDLPEAIDASGEPVHANGASPVPSLHWRGLRGRPAEQLDHRRRRPRRACRRPAGPGLSAPRVTTAGRQPRPPAICAAYGERSSRSMAIAPRNGPGARKAKAHCQLTPSRSTGMR